LVNFISRGSTVAQNQRSKAPTSNGPGRIASVGGQAGRRQSALHHSLCGRGR
jgi:hypothetical protein